MDICGPMDTDSHGGKGYFLTLNVTHYRYTELHLLRLQEEAKQPYYDFISLLDRIMGIKIQPVHADNAIELTSMKKELRKNGIRVTTSSP